MLRDTIDEDLVRRLVATQFPQWAGLEVRPVELSGWDNRTFRLGDELSVRLPSDEVYAAQVAKEQRWLPLLAPQLPLPIPAPVAKGVPAQGFPLPWSVYRWIDGRPAALAAGPRGEGLDLDRLAVDLAGFLNALRRIDATGGPAAGPHNFYRGGPLSTYAAETRRATATLADRIPLERVAAVWDAAMTAAWPGPPVWVHGDVAAGNLLVRDGRLAAVIDFGSSGVGDPACDTAISWTLLAGSSRERFRDALGLDRATWARGRGWVLWKALITIAGSAEDSALAAGAWHDLHEVLDDHDAQGEHDG